MAWTYTMRDNTTKTASLSVSIGGVSVSSVFDTVTNVTVTDDLNCGTAISVSGSFSSSMLASALNSFNPKLAVTMGYAGASPKTFNGIIRDVSPNTNGTAFTISASPGFTGDTTAIKGLWLAGTKISDIVKEIAAAYNITAVVEETQAIATDLENPGVDPITWIITMFCGTAPVVQPVSVKNGATDYVLYISLDASPTLYFHTRGYRGDQKKLGIVWNWVTGRMQETGHWVPEHTVAEHQEWVPYEFIEAHWEADYRKPWTQKNAAGVLTPDTRNPWDGWVIGHWEADKENAAHYKTVPEAKVEAGWSQSIWIAEHWESRGELETIWTSNPWHFLTEVRRRASGEVAPTYYRSYRDPSTPLEVMTKLGSYARGKTSVAADPVQKTILSMAGGTYNHFTKIPHVCNASFGEATVNFPVFTKVSLYYKINGNNVPARHARTTPTLYQLDKIYSVYKVVHTMSATEFSTAFEGCEYGK